jgi:PBP1b-binding outer membrane lipoprotein LpoB
MIKKSKVLVMLLVCGVLATGCGKKVNEDDDTDATVASVSETEVAQALVYPLTFSTMVLQGDTYTYDVMFSDDTVESIDASKIHISDGMTAELATAIGSDQASVTIMLKDISAEVGSYQIDVDAGAVAITDSDEESAAFSFVVDVYAADEISPYVTVSLICSSANVEDDEPIVVTVRYTGVSGDYLTQRISADYFEFEDCSGTITNITKQSKGALQVVEISDFVITGDNPCIVLKEGSALDMDSKPVAGARIAIE